MVEILTDTANQTSDEIITQEDHTFAQGWWREVEEYCDGFFEISARFEATHHPLTLESMRMDMELAMNTVVDAAYPPHIIPARRALLQAMYNVIQGYDAALTSNDRMAANYLAVARRHLRQFEADLAAFGLE